MNYSLKQLRVFVAIARHGSFSRAGEAIGLTQSAVSHSVKELEAEVGVRLLDRTTREVVLTDAGLRLANRVERLLDELQAALLDARSFGVQRSGTVRVATSQTISAHLMPQCIAAGEREYPEIRIMLRDQAQQQVLHSVRNAEVDFGIVVDPVQAVDLECEAVLHEPFLLLCRDDHPFAAQQEVRWSALNGCRLVLQDYASGSRPLIDSALRQQGVEAQVVQEIGHPATLFPMVAEGIGISIFPALALPLPEGGRLRVRRLVPEINRALMLVRRKNRSLTPAAEAIWQVARQQAALLHQRRQENAEY
ncbi:LysR family transcriptional regulator [Serratia sp. Lou2A]|jgi:DNA-binding transcriptional LysR family regulator|uniref:DNA-binding transcriptional LysR family regulator n=2 Tax=Serratia TaxID=613 RepID=A0AA46Q9D3_SERMA|nr:MULTISPECIES: LysR family transcriptional regulator [Serratia]MBI6124449.1 LysR family transcriptional regulator [Serratia marcescens]MCC7585479.1 LysR family transcriptional regulator [Serratia sp. Lou2A]MCC7660550.1 LysR family transcriptional regulator [Serratia sp. Pon4B]TQI83218.1 DNA-binding transcriptional LysR family regulator [Serratia marcescens]HEJ7119769.1 LysR family transcriptional regulator [Serratia marcescens]